MGKLTPAGPDLANIAVEAVLAANGDATNWQAFQGTFNVSMWSGAAATVKLQRSFDGGTTALDCNNLGLAVPIAANTSEQIESLEPGCLYRLIRTSVAGPCTARLSQ